MDDMPRLAQILKNIFYYAEVDGHSNAEIQHAIYAVITGGDTDTKPRGWGEDSLEHKAWKGGDIGKDTELWVYLPHPDEITRGNGKGYIISTLDQAFVRGVPKTSPEPSNPTVATKVNPKEIKAAKDQTFTDTVTLNNLTVGTEYTITGMLMDKSTQSEVAAKCSPVTFTADAASMEKEMTFTVDASSFAGKSLVVFETLSWTEDGESKSVGHNDYEDASQTLTVKKDEEPSGDEPYLKTEAKNTYISPAKNQSITDEVEYGGLTNGEDYVMVGVLKNKTTGETVNSKCTPVNITDAYESGVELMDFTKIDASGLKDGDQIVVFEYLYKGTKAGTPGDGTEIAKHEDINDEAQTVTVVDGKITLKKTSDIEDAEVGDVIPYEITVSSTRNIASVVDIGDYLGEYLEFVSASDGGELVDEDMKTVYWSAVEVPAKGSTTVTIKAKIKSGSGNKVVNEAYVGDDYNFANPMGSDDDSAVLGVYESSDKNGSNGNKNSTSKTKGAKTGDATRITLFVVVLILAAAFAATMIVRRRRSDR